MNQLIVNIGLLAVLIILVWNFRYKLLNFLRQRYDENREISEIKRQAYINRLKEMARSEGEKEAQDKVKAYINRLKEMARSEGEKEAQDKVKKRIELFK